MPSKETKKAESTAPAGQSTVKRTPDPSALRSEAEYDPAAPYWRASDVGGEDESLVGATGVPAPTSTTTGTTAAGTTAGTGGANARTGAATGGS